MTAIAIDIRSGAGGAPGTRIHTKMYNDFFKSKVLKPTEKFVFMALKNYLRLGTDEGDVYPSIETLAEDTGMERKTIMRALASMVSKGVISKISRGGQKSNVYHINDSSDVWVSKPDRSMEQDELDRAERLLREAGYKVEKPDASDISESNDTQTEEEHKKISDASTDQSLASEKTKGYVHSKVHTSSVNNVPKYTPESQPELSFDRKSASAAPVEEYPMGFIVDHFGTYVLSLSGISQRTVDAATKVLYDTLNSTRSHIRVAKVDRPASVVKSALLRLDHTALVTVLKKYDKISKVISHPDSYLLTLLYNALEQSSAPDAPPVYI